jgi:predicted RNA binding protein YcfA (HicA-like mRNA interferase family)
MPRKLRDLLRDLRRSGFEELPGRGKGDHAVWRHPSAPMNQLTIDGRPGDDAKPYQEKQLRAALEAVEAAERDAESE